MISFNNTYVNLPAACFEHVIPTPVKTPQLLEINRTLAADLGLDADWLASAAGVDVLSGNTVAQGSETLAMAYAGHQFGQWVPQLGDGRAILLGEVLDPQQQRFDLQLKGAGRTPFSRGGDGRNWVGPVLREYLVSEAMAALAVPTTRALAAVSTGEPVLRENGPMPGAIITRVAHSHLRVGTFQYFAARDNHDALQALIDYALERHYPTGLAAENRAHALLDAVIDAQASLVAKWQSIGFIHGVMNTDNCSIGGLTIDYGPCAFMDTYQADRIFSSIDRGARYAYKNQPGIAQWNLLNLAQCLLPFIHEDSEKAVELAQSSINRFNNVFIAHYSSCMRAKLGLDDQHDDDLELVSDLLESMEEHKLDFTVTFSQLANPHANNVFAVGGPLFDWHLRWQRRLDNDANQQQASQERMRRVNPALIPRNHLIESLIHDAVTNSDFNAFHQMLKVVTDPYNAEYLDSQYALPPMPDQVVTQTFCGT